MTPLTAAEFAPDFPDDELIVYRNTALDVECLIAIPKAKIAQVLGSGGQPPFWRHGEIMNVRLANDQGAPSSLRSADESNPLSRRAA